MVSIIVATPLSHILFRAIREIEDARVESECLSGTDQLTGVLNRRRFIELAEREIARSGRDGRVLSVLILDIDDFKRINDTRVHRDGDAELRRVAAVCRSALRPGNRQFRYCVDRARIVGH